MVQGLLKCLQGWAAAKCNRWVVHQCLASQRPLVQVRHRNPPKIHGAALEELCKGYRRNRAAVCSKTSSPCFAVSSQ
jgi:hypothetical protein